MVNIHIHLAYSQRFFSFCWAAIVINWPRTRSIHTHTYEDILSFLSIILKLPCHILLSHSSLPDKDKTMTHENCLLDRLIQTNVARLFYLHLSIISFYSKKAKENSLALLLDRSVLKEDDTLESQSVLCSHKHTHTHTHTPKCSLFFLSRAKKKKKIPVRIENMWTV